MGYHNVLLQLLVGHIPLVSFHPHSSLPLLLAQARQVKKITMMQQCFKDTGQQQKLIPC